MPEVFIDDQTFARFQSHAKPLLDNINTVANRALDALDQVTAPAAQGQEPSKERRIDPRELPKLTHTKVLDAVIDGDQISKPNWNRLLDDVLRRVMKQVGTFEKLKQACPVNVVKGSKTDEGYN